MNGSTSAFSLVELSIVLVILGLLTGGILAGQSLIRAAELRSVSTQYNTYMTAVQTFRDKYFALPGDMRNASTFWGAADGSTGNTVACATTASSSPLTCNGDGSGLVDPTTASFEQYRFWQHLTNAGLIEGSYNGIPVASGATTANVPRGKIGNTLWFANYWGTISSNPSFFDGNYGNALEFGAVLAGTDPRNPSLKPEEAWNLDTKLDDGRPARGKLIARDVGGFTGANCTTATGSTMLDASYALTNSSVMCVIIFPQAF